MTLERLCPYFAPGDSLACVYLLRFCVTEKNVLVVHHSSSFCLPYGSDGIVVLQACATFVVLRP